MTFSDNDLKRLKDCAYSTPNDNWIGLFNKVSKSYEKFNLNALLARFEAAEELSMFAGLLFKDSPMLKKLFEEWRKAAGIK